MERDAARFVSHYSAEIDAGNAAIFAGAGLSVPAGFVDWRNLLRRLAEELDLDIDRETDLVGVAQFYVNHRAGNRSELHRAVIEALALNLAPTANHRRLARLPITTWWTTNYDQLIERSLREAGKVVDVKTAVSQLASTRPRRDAIVYKMHGDVDRPEEAVVTRDDYERYPRDRGAFVTTLAADLVSKTFLFLGFSFTDPNLEQVLARLRISHDGNLKRHFAILRRRARTASETDAEFHNAAVRQGLFIKDLLRFNVDVVLVDSYAEVDEMLEELVRRFRRQTVFLSASAADFAPWGEEAVTEFMRQLGGALVRANMRIVTGLGGGVGNGLLTGALECLLADPNRHIEDALVLRPFPRKITDPVRKAEVHERYRQSILAEAGLALFLFGNKRRDGSTAEAAGVRREFEIAGERGLLRLPIGATGSTAATLATLALSDPNTYLAELDEESRTRLAALAEPVQDLGTLVAPIVELVTALRHGGAAGNVRR